MKQNNIAAVLAKHPLIPVVTIHSEAEIAPMMEKLFALEIACIEITLRTDYAMEAIRRIKEEYGHRISVGVGTVINTDQVDELLAIVPDFIVCPGLTTQLGKHLDASGMAFIPGVSTPSEIMHALENGWDVLKFFPAHLFGGLTALKTYGGVFPSVTFCPTGGIDGSTFDDYLALPNVISVGGSWMLK